MPRGLSGTSPANLQKYLRGARYPADKRELVETAMQNDATHEILDLLWKLPDEEFGGPQDVQKGYGELDNGERRTGRQQDDDRPYHLILDFLEVEGQAESFAISKMLNREGVKQSASKFLSEMVREGVIEKNDGKFTISERSSSRGRERTRSENDGRGRASENEDDGYDRRLKGHETAALRAAREMQRGYDGRGRVTDPEQDRRLKENETEALADARHMKHGYDGRGRVRRFGRHVDETIGDDRERYEEARRRRDEGAEPDPETGARSRRRKNDEGELVGARQRWQDRYRDQMGGDEEE